MNLEKVVANLARKVQQRYYGKYRGLVVDNADPEQLGRLKLQIPSVLGEEVVTGWAMPCVPYGGDANQGFLFIPEVDAGVWVEFEEGDLEFPIWVGTFWSKPGGNSELPKPNDPDGSEQGSVQNPPTRKIIKTKKGHTIQFEDADGEERILISDGESENRMVLSKSGVSIVNKENSIMMTEQGITIEDANGNKITMAFSGTNVVKVNGEKKVCLEGLVNWLMSHTHLGNMGAPCPLNPADMGQLISALPTGDGNILSLNVKAG